MKTNLTLTWLLLLGLLILVMLLDILIGSVHIPIGEVFTALSGGNPSNPGWSTIINEFRVPKAVTALCAGSGLAVSGLLMQTLFRNPLAGPFVLGISSGASLGVALAVMASSVFGMMIGGFAGGWMLVLAAISGAAGVFLLILIISISVRDSMTLLIIGLMVGSLSGAVVSILQYHSEAREIQSFLIWTFGNLGGVHHQELLVLSITVVFGLIMSWYLSKPLDALLLGESYATSLGVGIKKIRISVLVAASILAGGITAFCGPLAFVGIAIPHLTRIIFKTANHRHLVPGCILIGAITMILCDLASQIPGSSRTLPINAITSLVGAPAVIAILIRSRNLSKSFS